MQHQAQRSTRNTRPAAKGKRPPRQPGKWDHLKPLPQQQGAAFNARLEMLVRAFADGEMRLPAMNQSLIGQELRWDATQPTFKDAVLERGVGDVVVARFRVATDTLSLHGDQATACALLGVQARRILALLVTATNDNGDPVLALTPEYNGTRAAVCSVHAIYAACAAVLAEV